MREEVIKEVTPEEILAEYQEEQPENQDKGENLLKVDLPTGEEA